MRHIVLALPFLLVGCLPTPAPAQTAPTVQVAFSPGGGCEATVVQAIASARQSAHVAIYDLTDKAISQAIIQAHRRGIDVQVIADPTQSHMNYSTIPLLIQAGVPVRFDYHDQIMHDKYAIIDGTSIVTGSFNWTNAAEHRNAENLLWLENIPGLAQQYERDWQDLWRRSQ